jgi:NAD(P)-dependent dehydrogenase (short-subunit alcohol dehydrogenase family)
MNDQVVVVTGASSGIGRATALHLASRGYLVHATMRTPEIGGPPLVEQARSEGLQLSVSQLDVTEPASVARAVSAVLTESGHIDVLINNAGIGDLGPIEMVSEDATRRMFETNVFGPLRMLRAVLPGMRERQHGTIVNVSSVAGRIVGGGNGMYAATKHALEAASEALALEVRQFGIRVAIIEPGFFATPIIDKATNALSGDTSSPYAHVERRMRGIYQGAKPLSGDPQMVAEVIEQAITTEEPSLRTLVGFDAAPFVEGRSRMTDEEYVEAFGREMTDEEYFIEFARRFPMPSTV